MSDNSTTEPQVTRYECDDLAHFRESSVGELVYYDDYLAIVSERDEWRDAAKWAEGQHQHWKTVASATQRTLVALRVDHAAELDRMKARLAACERVVEVAIEWLGAVGGDHTRAEARMASVTYDYTRAAVAAETQEKHDA
jgi:hypothetical protein